MPLDEFLALIESKTGHRPKVSGNGYAARCPCSAHNDKRPSLSIACGDDRKILLHCHAGCSFDAICQELGVAPSQLFHKEKHTTAANQFYYYHNENGDVLYRKVKTPKKSFYFERFENGTWLRGLGNSRRVLYNLPEVIDAIQEGRQLMTLGEEKTNGIKAILRYLKTLMCFCFLITIKLVKNIAIMLLSRCKGTWRA